MFSAISDSAAASKPQIHLDRDRAAQRLDHLDEPQPPRLRGQVLGVAGDKGEGLEIDLEALLDARPQHLHRDRAAAAIGRDLGAMHLRDRGGRDRRAERREQRRTAAARTRPRSCARPRPAGTAPSCPAAFEVARQHDADHVRPRRQELAELHVGGTEPGQGRGQPIGRDACSPAARSAAPARKRRAPAAAAASDRRGRSTPSRANTKPARARPDQVGQSLADHNRQPECSATMPPVSAGRRRGQTRPPASSRQRPPVAETGGSIRPDSDRPPRRR